VAADVHAVTAVARELDAEPFETSARLWWRALVAPRRTAALVAAGERVRTYTREHCGAALRLVDESDPAVP
jgi:hypothetical protein